MSETTVFYKIDGQTLELHCDWNEKRAAINDLKAQGLLVTGYKVHGTGRDMKEACKCQRAGR